MTESASLEGSPVWPGGATVAVSVQVLVEEGAEHTGVDAGPENFSEALQLETHARDLFTESLFEYGARCGIWRLLDVLDEHRVPATFFCCARALQRNSSILPEIRRAGHEVAGHGYRWVSYDTLDAAAERDDIARCVAALRAATGDVLRGWRSRAPSERTRSLLREAGVDGYDSDGHAADHPYYVPVVRRDVADPSLTPDSTPRLVVPPTPELDDLKYWAPPRTVGYQSVDDLLAFARLSADWLGGEPGRPSMLGITVRPRITGRPERAGALGELLAEFRSRDDTWFACAEDIAGRWSGVAPGSAAETTEST